MDTPSKPFVSVLMPVRNEGVFIRRSLESVLNQDYPSEKLEIVIADGMSEDGTREMILEFQKKSSSLKLINNPKKIVATGLNLAIREAKGDIIIRVDGHTAIAPDYVSACVSALNDSAVDNAGGRMDAEGKGPFAQAVVFGTNSPFGVGGARFHYLEKAELVDTVYLGAWRRSAFEKYGFFDEEMVRNQDDEFNYRIREAGGRILLSPLIRSKYWVRESAIALWKQYFQYGFWKVRVMQKHPRQMQWRQFVPPLFVFSLPASFLGGFFIPVSMALFFFILKLYLAADLAASFSTSFKKGWKHFPLLLIIYPILHLSYGFGFLTGLICFWNRRGLL